MPFSRIISDRSAVIRFCSWHFHLDSSWFSSCRRMRLRYSGWPSGSINSPLWLTYNLSECMDESSLWSASCILIRWLGRWSWVEFSGVAWNDSKLLESNKIIIIIHTHWRGMLFLLPAVTFSFPYLWPIRWTASWPSSVIHHRNRSIWLCWIELRWSLTFPHRPYRPCSSAWSPVSSPAIVVCAVWMKTR